MSAENQKVNNFEKIKNELIQILRTLKKLHEYSTQYRSVEVYTEKEKYTIKHLIEDEILRLKDEIDSLGSLIEFLHTQINHARAIMNQALQDNDQETYIRYSKQITFQIDNLDKLYNSFSRINELIQKYYTMIIDYENKLVDNINKTYRSLLYKDDKKSDNILITELYQRLEELVRQLPQQQDIDKSNSTDSDNLFPDEYKL
jgi:hypothetical protein